MSGTGIGGVGSLGNFQTAVPQNTQDPTGGATPTTSLEAAGPTTLNPQALSGEISVNRPKWGVLNKEIIDNLKPGQKILCRLMRYDYPYYINKKLVNELNLPLINNYFILENAPGPAVSNDPITAEDSEDSGPIFSGPTI